jgi:hypothetical protein
MELKSIDRAEFYNYIIADAPIALSARFARTLLTFAGVE